MNFYSGDFFGGLFFGRIEVIDTHDGERKRRRYAEQKEAGERLRAQIRAAIEGPSAPILVPALERMAEAGAEPLEARVDIGELVAQVELWRAVREAAAKAARDDEDDVEVLLLS